MALNRLSELRELYALARAELAESDPGSGASLLRECRFLLQEISELESGVGSEEAAVSALDAARKRREERLKKKA